MFLVKSDCLHFPVNIQNERGEHYFSISMFLKVKLHELITGKQEFLKVNKDKPPVPLSGRA